MKLLLIPVWASLIAETTRASILSPAFLGVPEPSTAAMLIVGVCVLAVGLTGRRRSNSGSRSQ
ncbi:MAG TPA: PEP-CTERM sorting domain-containing protein [Bryobacteraceae bacterium]|jgi:hypothetical protein